eukprot:UN21132
MWPQNAILGPLFTKLQMLSSLRVL